MRWKRDAKEIFFLYREKEGKKIKGRKTAVHGHGRCDNPRDKGDPARGYHKANEKEVKKKIKMKEKEKNDTVEETQVVRVFGYMAYCYMP